MAAVVSPFPNDVDALKALLNGESRKTLGWKTPAEALDKCLAQIEEHAVATTS